MHPHSPDKQQDLCIALEQRGTFTVADARQLILSSIKPLSDKERIQLKESLGRILGEELFARFDVPPWNNSAVDGYAVRGEDLSIANPCRLTVIGNAMAGSPFPGTVATGQCVRIMTGAVIPYGCDTVIMQEQVVRDGDDISIGARHIAGEYVRRAGEDLAAGQRVLGNGRRITPADMGLLASLGIGQVTVSRRPHIAYFSTGNELRTISEILNEGEIYDSNHYTLHGALQHIGIEPVDMGIVRDDHDALHSAISKAAASMDAIITTGGVSVGDADFVRDSLAKSGKIYLWKVGVKPGRPFAFGRIGRAWFFGLPGNPVSALVTYYQFVQPALQRLMGEEVAPPLQFKVTCITPLKKTPGRVDFQRGILETNAAGETVVRSTGEQNSNILRSMSDANCFIVLPAEWGDVPAGTLVEVQAFTEF